MSIQKQLLKERRFMPLFITQFLGAFNDNLFKNALVVLLVFKAASWTSLKPEMLGNLAAGIFILPFFLFSATAGQLVDKFDKARVARVVKLLEILIMALACIGFVLHSLVILLTALFLMGMHSTLFGPVKYAILPQHLHSNELVAGNALVEAGTFTAILLGTLAGGLLASLDGGILWICIAVLLVALAGYVASLRIPAAPSFIPDLGVRFNPVTDTWRCIAQASRNRDVFIAIIGLSWFWLYGSLFLAQFPAYVKSVLGGGEGMVTTMLALFTVGIGVGSLTCDRLSRHTLDLALVPLGAVGLTLFGLDFGLASPAQFHASDHTPIALVHLLSLAGTWRILVDLTLIGAFGGFYCVPLYALLQSRCVVDMRARTIAANNIMNALFMVTGALGASVLFGAGLSIPGLFLLTAVVNAIVAAALFYAAPEFMQRLGVRMGELTARKN
jgi:MFS family permease